MALIGRAQIVDRLGRNEAPVLVLSGDSGIGKSRVLLSSTQPRDGWFSPPPQSVHRQSGAFYAAYLDALVDALSSMVASGVGAESISDRLVELGRRLADEQLTVLGRVAFSELVALVRARIGDDAGKASVEFVSRLIPDDAARLAARANQARDPLTVEVLAEFAKAAVDLAGERHIALSFDQAERLGEDDLRLVADLAERLPERFHIRLAVVTDNADRAHAVATLRAEVTAIDGLEVEPLGEEALAEWLDAEGLDAALAAALHRQTSGYPILVESAIAELHAGNDLIELPRDEQLVRRTEQSWQRLSADAQSVARRLAVLPDPLPESELRALAGIEDVSQWATIVEELRRSRIFSVPVDGQLWFHSQRRRFVLSDCLSPDQRDEIASATATFLWERGFGPLDFRMQALYAQVVTLGPTFAAGDEQVKALAGISRPALAVAAALLELAVQGRMAATGDSLVSHALSFIDAIEDPVATIQELEDAGLVVTARNNWTTAVAAGWSPEAQAFVQGRAGLELRRSPVMQLAEVMFTLVLRPALDGFSSANFGIGNPSIGGLGRVAAGADEHSGYVNRGRLGTYLLVNGSLVGDVPFYLAASFDEPGERDAAFGQVDQLDVASPVGRVRVRRAWKHPQEPVPLQRFAQALARARAEHVGMPRDRGEIRLASPVRMSDDEIAEQRVHAAELLHELATANERAAMELEDGYLLAWFANEHWWAECVVQGAGGFDARRVPVLGETTFAEQFRGLRLRQALGLNPSQVTAHMMESSTRYEPLAREIGYRRSRANKFNSAQPHLRVSLAEAPLQSLFDSAFKEHMRIARLFRETFPRSTSADAKLGSRAIWLALAPGEPVAGWMPGAQGSALSVEGPSPDNQDHVFLKVIDGERQEGGVFGAHYRIEPVVFDELFPAAMKESGALSDPLDAIATLSGHHPDDLRLVWPDDE